MRVLAGVIDRVHNLAFPPDRDLKDMLTARMRAMALRDYQPLGYVLSLAMAPDEIPMEEGHPLLERGRDCTIRWEADTAPFLCVKGDMLLFAHPLEPLPLTVDRAHPTERGEWLHTMQGRVWVPGDEYFDDASQVSGALKEDGRTRETPDPTYNYGGVKNPDPRRMISQYHEDGVTPLAAGKQIVIGGNTFFLCQPVIQITIKAWADGKRTSLQLLKIRADRRGRHMAFLYPLLGPEAGDLRAAPAFLVHGEWRTNAREDGN